jgi:hypothetical protein
MDFETHERTSMLFASDRARWGGHAQGSGEQSDCPIARARRVHGEKVRNRRVDLRSCSQLLMRKED